MNFYSVVCRFMLAALFVLTGGNVKAQTYKKLIGVPYKEALSFNEQVAKMLNLLVDNEAEERTKGYYEYEFYNTSDSLRVNMRIGYAIYPKTGLVGGVYLYGRKDYLSEIYKTLFDKKFAPKNPNSVLAHVTRGNEYIAINTGFDDGNIRIEEKGK
ncbi:hypothetical protein HGH93_04810 [Chitinophaga polysaccharea]|uniref:hypothetical protein n=1 Tax=Chitinophaga polysaccharea TaxID=1293035 RepID=UPI0014551CE7|nr:hypothetical protein [Chitinophaga polysaccharea]NLR57404.1 hypothetical protein [Chitinophaga polysaccharea]